MSQAWDRTGLVELTGHRDGPALVPPGTAPEFAEMLASRIERSARLSGHLVDIDGPGHLGLRARLRRRAGVPLHRGGRVSAGGGSRLLRAADAWIAVSSAREDDPWLLAAAAGVRIDAPEVPWRAVESWLARSTAAEIAESFAMLGIAGGPVADRVPESAELPERAGTIAAALELPIRAVDGLRVVDFSSLWAGPLAAHLLVQAGASVTCVESALRPDGARRGDPELHALLRENTRRAQIDHTDPTDLERVRALVDDADIVIEASRPRALRSWGLDASAFAQRGGTWVSITAAGRSQQRVGFGDDIAASAGLLATDADGLPVFCGDAIADPLAGLTAAALAVSDVSGVIWDCAMVGIAQECAGPDRFRGLTAGASARVGA